MTKEVDIDAKKNCASFPSVYPESVTSSTRCLKEQLNEFAVFSSATESAAIFGKFLSHKLYKFLGVLKFSFLVHYSSMQRLKPGADPMKVASLCLLYLKP